MSTAYAEREREQRGLGDRVEIVTGGTDPADSVHDEVIDVREEGFELSDRTSRDVSESELRRYDFVATMGCSTLDVGGVEHDVDVRDWALADPDGATPEEVRRIRDDAEERVQALFDELERELGGSRE